MLGSMVGLLIKDRPPGALQDEAYLIEDAKRLYAISQNTCSSDFEYPSPMTWRSPASLADYITQIDGELVLSPFGKVTVESEEFPTRNSRNLTSYYQWVTTSFGPSFLIKRRELNRIKVASMNLLKNHSVEIEASLPQQLEIGELSNQEKGSLINNDGLYDKKVDHENVIPPKRKQDMTLDIDQLTNTVIKNGFPPALIGEHIISIAGSKLGTNGVIGYSAIISKAIVVRK
jgi:hypothetical protein